MTNVEKQWIDSADYEQLLRRWRYAPVGDSMFQGDTGQYYQETLFRKRDELGQQAAEISKSLG